MAALGLSVFQSSLATHTDSQSANPPTANPEPTNQPTNQPQHLPTNQPTIAPANKPTNQQEHPPANKRQQPVRMRPTDGKRGPISGASIALDARPAELSSISHRSTAAGRRAVSVGPHGGGKGRARSVTRMRWVWHGCRTNGICPSLSPPCSPPRGSRESGDSCGGGEASPGLRSPNKTKKTAGPQEKEKRNNIATHIQCNRQQSSKARGNAWNPVKRLRLHCLASVASLSHTHSLCSLSHAANPACLPARLSPFLPLPPIPLRTLAVHLPPCVPRVRVCVFVCVCV